MRQSVKEEGRSENTSWKRSVQELPSYLVFSILEQSEKLHNKPKV